MQETEERIIGVISLSGQKRMGYNIQVQKLALKKSLDNLSLVAGRQARGHGYSHK